MFWFFGHEACRILAPPPGMESTPPALEGEVLTTGPPGKSLILVFLPLLKAAHNLELHLRLQTRFFFFLILFAGIQHQILNIKILFTTLLVESQWERKEGKADQEGKAVL